MKLNIQANFRMPLQRAQNVQTPFRLLTIFLAVLAALSLSGCVGLTGAGTPAASSTTTAGGTLAASATSVAFGNVNVGTTVSQTLTLTNSGTADVTISQVTVTGTGFSLVGSASAISVPAGQSHGFQVQFAPHTAGSATGSVSVTSDASNPTVSIALAGTAMSSLTINTQPASQTVTAGQSATFNVAATGNGTLTYLWSKNGVAISGATSASYTTPATTSADNGAHFTVSVTDSTGSVTSNSATLTVTATAVAPTISSQPASQTVSAGQTATFSVTAAGTATLSYQWTRNGAAISGATSASYTTPATVAADNGAKFAVTVTNSVSSVTSSAATLTVNVPPTISAQPASKSVTAGQTATFSVTASGTGTMTYLWYKNGVSIGGATSASYTTPATALADNGALFNVTVSSATGSVTSSSAVLTVNAAAVAPTITGQPASRTVTMGQTAAFSVTATGTATMTYQWKKNGAAISGATSPSYTTPATVAGDNGAQFTVTVSNSVGNATSNAAVLTVNVPPSITAQPASKTVTAGQTATFSVTASGSGTLTYQWNKNGAAISGATSATYTTPATVNTDNGSLFTVTVTGGTGSVTSNSATLTVTAAPVAPSITGQPASKTVTAGQTATFTVTATGTATLTYQWKKNGAAISGATSASYTTPATTSTDNGASFTVTVTNSVNSVTSSAATLTVTSASVAPSITGQPASKTVTAGQTATFTVTATGTATLTYQWNKNGAAISGATSASYTTPATTSADNGATFTVTVTNAAGNATSNSATLTVTAATLVLNANKTSLSFGNVNTTASSALTVIFTNAGNSNVNISNVSVSGAGFTGGGVSSGQILTPGQTATLTVTFAPAAAGAVTGTATVTSNATTSPATIALSGTGVAPVAHSVSLGWTASTSAVSGYNVYRSSVSGGPYTKLTSSLDTLTTYVDSTVQSAQTYFYVATSVDSTGAESTFSAEVSATIP
jgi:hypothetical protein